MQQDSKYVYAELLRWSAYMRSLTFLKPCLQTFTGCWQVESAWVRAQKGRCQKPLVKRCEECMCLDLWLQSKAEIHLGLTCLRFSRSSMERSLTPKLVIPWMHTQGVRSWGVCTPDQDFCQMLFHFIICAQVWLQVVSFHPTSAFCS